ncbi:radical SAM protein [Brachyspira intermedia]|uniref:radical SAM protein n=1 Tax=Brachyspira intermedia TaxID=84377 RepID=UPI0030070ACE
MNNKLIDNIVWWIPIKKIRDKVKLNLYQKYDYDANIISTLEYKLKKLTPQPFIDIIELDISEHCNLNCYSCSHFSQLSNEQYYDLEIFENDIKQLSQITYGLINRFHVMGGEPLLNKNCTDYFYILRKYFNKSNIWLVTNGILLTNQNKNFWLSCKDNNIEIHPTKYPININWDKIHKISKEFGVVIDFFNNSNTKDDNFINESIKFILDINGNMDSYNNFTNCWEGNNCIHLKNGKIYTCSRIPNIWKFNNFFSKNLEVTPLDYIDIYKVKNYNEILNFLSKPIPFCRYCDFYKTRGIGSWKKSSKIIEEYIDK